jgi:hypothetical protein
VRALPKRGAISGRNATFAEWFQRAFNRGISEYCLAALEVETIIGHLTAVFYRSHIESTNRGEHTVTELYITKEQ